jgi:hypothetical protein
MQLLSLGDLPSFNMSSQRNAMFCSRPSAVWSIRAAAVLRTGSGQWSDVLAPPASLLFVNLMHGLAVQYRGVR